MGSLYRSIEMCRCQLFLQTDVAFHTVAELGELGLTMFKDLNPDINAFQRNFVNEVRRCDEMERQLRFIEKELKRDQVEIFESGEIPDCPLPSEMVGLEATFTKMESEIKEMNVSALTLQKNYSDLTELRNILQKSDMFFPTAAQARMYMNDYEEVAGEPVALDYEIQKGEKDELSYIVGTVANSKAMAFEKLLWRATRGNIYLKMTPIEEPIFDTKTREFVLKTIFIIFYQGNQLRNRVKKIIDGFHALSYDIPETQEERNSIYTGVLTRIEDLNIVLGQTTDHRRRALIAAAKNIRIWFAKVWKMKAVYHTLNLFSLDVTQKCFIAECWLPIADFDKVHMALKRGLDNGGGSVASVLDRLDTKQAPPTYYRTNKFTEGFQSLVSSYGVACYREANPAPYTIITFPFLFAVMFGDLGHGFIMFLFALFLVVKEKALERAKIRDEIFQIFFGGRYIILLMGMFSMYTGILYNELFSKAMNIFGSAWHVDYDNQTISENELLMMDPADYNSYNGVPYPFGIDPVWSMSENSLTFLNSFKMKMSVIIGISQMVFGVMISLVNFVYFKSKLDIFGVFVPQILFISSIFVYLCVMIIYKWIAFSASEKVFSLGIAFNATTDSCNPNDYLGTFCSPSLLIGLINMFMFTYPGEGFCGDNCSVNTFYPYQKYVQEILVIIAVICIPWMLFTKPFVIRSRHNKEVAQKMAKEEVQIALQVRSDNGHATHDAHTKPHSKKEEEEEEWDFTEVFIHQAIHTIEYCLGCISHTASYLRLWALSLAHSELSNVLWKACAKVTPMVPINGAPIFVGGVATYVVFWIFAGITIAVLLVMEGLSAFLHALRLHWVEFQSKFYLGDGYAFEPFDFAIILRDSEEALYMA